MLLSSRLVSSSLLYFSMGIQANNCIIISFNQSLSERENAIFFEYDRNNNNKIECFILIPSEIFDLSFRLCKQKSNVIDSTFLSTAFSARQRIRYQSSFFFMQLKYSFFHCVLADNSPYVDILILSNSMYSFHRLVLNCWVPPTVTKNNIVRSN